MKKEEKALFFKKYKKLIFGDEDCYESFHLHNDYTITKSSLSNLEELFQEFADAKGDINNLLPDMSISTPVWLSLLLITECLNQDLDYNARMGLLREKLNYIKSIKKPLYKKYRGSDTTYNVALSASCYVTARILVEDGFDLSLEKVPAVQTTIDNFSIQEQDATVNEQEKVLEAVLKTGISPDEGYESKKSFPLTLACGKSLVGCSRLLLEYNANTNIAEKTGATPILHCVDDPTGGVWEHWTRNKTFELTELLLQHGAKIDVRTTQNRTFHSMVKKVSKGDFYRSDSKEVIAERKEEEKRIFALVEKYLGKAALTPPPQKKKKDFEQLLNEFQLAHKDDYFNDNLLTGVDLIHKIVEWYKLNKVIEFEAGHVTKSIRELDIKDQYSKNVRCPPSTAKRYLEYIIKGENESHCLEQKNDIFYFS